MNKGLSIGSKRGREVCNILNIDWPEKALDMELHYIYAKRTRKQNSGFWALLSTWVREGGLRATKEDLYTVVMRHSFGVVQVPMPDGTFIEKNNRTLTKRWCSVLCDYVDCRMSRADASDLIERVYYLAANGTPCVVLPDLKRQEAIEELSGAE